MFKRVLFIISLIAIIASMSSADMTTWTNANHTNLWSDDGNWDQGAPSSADFYGGVIDSNDPNECIIDALTNATSYATLVGFGQVADEAHGIPAKDKTGHLVMTGGTFTSAGLTAGQEGIGNLGTGLVTMSGGTMTLTSDARIGTYGGIGTFDISGGIVNQTAGWTYIGTNGATGTFNFHNHAGTYTTPSFRVGAGGGPNPFVTTANISDGNMVFNGDSTVGQDANGVGTLNMTGGKINHTAGLYIVGYNGGQGHFNMKGGTLTTPSLRVSYYNLTATSDVNVTGGTITVNSDMSIGQGNNCGGTLKVAGGTVNHLAGAFYAGFFSGGHSLIDIQEGTLKSPRIEAGFASICDVNVSGGLLEVNSDFIIGRTSTGVGTINMTGGTINAKNGWIYLGFEGATSTINLLGGKISTLDLWFPDAAVYPDKALLDISGGTLEIRRTDATALTDTIFKYVAYLGAPSRHQVTAYGGAGSLYIHKDPVTGYILIQGCNPGLGAGDLNYDCIVDFKDLSLFVQDWLDGFNFTAYSGLASEWRDCNRDDGTCP